MADVQAAYDRREAELGADTMRELERQVLLTVLDRKWREHLYEMDYLREGIGLRAMAQRDPLVEYQREGGQMFNAMMEAFMEEVVGYLFNLEVQVGPQVAPVMTAEGAPVDVDELLAGMGRGPIPSSSGAGGGSACPSRDPRAGPRGHMPRQRSPIRRPTSRGEPKPGVNGGTRPPRRRRRSRESDATRSVPADLARSSRTATGAPPEPPAGRCHAAAPPAGATTPRSRQHQRPWRAAGTIRRRSRGRPRGT